MESDISKHYRWTSTVVTQPAEPDDWDMNVYGLPPATMAEASRRISLLYENIIFKDVEEPDDEDAIAAEDSKDGYIQGGFTPSPLCHLIHDDRHAL
jgi:hypothetical protein